MKHQEFKHKIIGACMEVHKYFENGFQELLYKRALDIEMELIDLNHSREFEMSLDYKNHEVRKRRVNFFVEDQIMLEIKAVVNLEDVHLAQAMNFVEAYGLEIGLLVNFGSRSMQFKRVHNNSRKRVFNRDLDRV